LIDSGIRRVVCPIEDPNPLVSGKGFAHLRGAGLEVVTGILADEAAKMNEKFICWHKKHRPFVHIKLASSLDGRISLDRSVSTPVSGDAALKRVHDLRHEYDAILVGGNTAAVDDPSLTDRSGKPRRRPLLRVVLDNRLRLEMKSKLVATAQDTPTLVFSNNDDPLKNGVLERHGAQIFNIDARDLNAVLGKLYRREIQSVLVEGGSELAGSFRDAGLVDKYTFIYSPMVIGGRDAPVAVGGAGAAALNDVERLTDITVTLHGEDIEVTGYPVTSDAC
jgi:diaminohydroxyphosphoribosylaminopyrimidine deaminase/5-amino-6-(5-phosphoribosylamino)uracil reductase